MYLPRWLGTNIASTDMVSYLVLLAPVVGWYLYSHFNIGEVGKDSIIIKLLKWIYIILIFFFLLSTGVKWISNAAAIFGWIDQGEQVDMFETSVKLYDKVIEWMQDIGKTMLNLPSKVQEQRDELLEKATGGYYEGRVEKNKKEPIGVYITEFKAADSIYFKDEVPTLWATVTGRSFDDAINMQLTCFARDSMKFSSSLSKSQKIIPGNVQPTTQSTLFATDTQYYDCVFEPEQLPDGTVQTSFSVTFDFKTMSYIKAYFMDYETRQSLVRQGVDPLKTYDIKDKTPVAVYTNGPMKMGMGIQPLTGVKDEGTVSSIGFSLDNKWDGKLFEIDELTLLVPLGITIDSEDNTACNKKFYAVDAGWCKNKCELEKLEQLQFCQGIQSTE